MPPMASAPTILVFDSGLGGLTVFREAIKARPDARFVYAADDAFFPYGRQEEPKLVARVLEVMGELIAAHRPDLVVVACNTASTIVLPQLRERFKVPFVGTVPAIKPACSTSNTKRVTVLGTEATVKREYTRKLIAEHGNGCEVKLVGSPRCAELAEAELKGEPVSDTDIASRNRTLLRRIRRQAHRYDRAGLHSLPAAAGAHAKARPLAGQFHRPCPRHRPPRRRLAGPGGSRGLDTARARYLHLGPKARAAACRGA